jgi:coenzyme F420 hydrogenase subunit beta
MDNKVNITTECTGCGNCIVACPGNGFMGVDSKGGLGPKGKAALILKEGGGVFLDDQVCVKSDSRGCKECHDVCPMNAVTYNLKFAFSNLEEEVISKGLCSGCGGCTAVCPENIIKMDEFPFLDGDCTSCGYCITHCPRYSHSLRDAFPTNMWDRHIVGRIKYKCAAKSKVTIPGVQDGGFVMALLKHVLENKIIDAAIIVTNAENEPQRAKTIITSDVDSLHRGAGSKYSNGSILSILKDAKESGIKNIGIVGLPCQMEGLMKLYTSPQEDIDFYNMISLRIGLFCKGTFMYQGLKDTIENYVPILEVDKVDIKGKYMNITSNGEIIKAPLKEVLKHKRSGCKSCTDLTSKFSDFAVGSVGSPGTHSTVLVRSTIAQKILEDMVDEDTIDIQPIEEKGNQLMERLAKMKRREAFELFESLKSTENNEMESSLTKL